MVISCFSAFFCSGTIFILTFYLIYYILFKVIALGDRVMQQNHKECTKCGKTKPFLAFSKDKKGQMGLQHSCKQCRHEYYLSNKDRQHKKQRNRRLKLDYGLSCLQYDSMLKEQGGVCCICGLPETQRTGGPLPNRLSVDHCHASQKVRGLLCHKCNTLLGMVNDDIDILASAISYLVNASI